MKIISTAVTFLLFLRLIINNMLLFERKISFVNHIM